MPLGTQSKGAIMAHYLNIIAVMLVPAVIGVAGLLLGTAWYELTHQRR
jgi:hypothetical protein